MTKSDLASCLTVVSKLNADINTHSVRDCLRLGNYKKESSRPRPILLKLNRSFDVSNVLANRAETPQGITIKPDQTKEERQRESLLLGVRWKLLQMGTDKKDIKIRASTVYLKGNKHAQVINNCLQYFNYPNQTTSMAVDSVTNPISTDSADQVDHSSHEDVHLNTSNWLENMTHHSKPKSQANNNHIKFLLWNARSLNKQITKFQFYIYAADNFIQGEEEYFWQ